MSLWRHDPVSAVLLVGALLIEAGMLSTVVWW